MSTVENLKLVGSL